MLKKGRKIIFGEQWLQMHVPRKRRGEKTERRFMDGINEDIKMVGVKIEDSVN